MSESEKGEKPEILLEEVREIEERKERASANRSDQEVILKYMEDYFFGESSAFPPGYVPPKSKG